MGREMNRDLKEKGKKYRRFPIFQTDSTSNNLGRKYKTRRRRDGKLNKGGGGGRGNEEGDKRFYLEIGRGWEDYFRNGNSIRIFYENISGYTFVSKCE